MGTRNGETYLREQLDSILAQSLLPTEMIVSDDASSDRTLEILRSFKDQSPFPVTIVCNQTGAGACKNFENAIRHCGGEIIILADQDDVWLPSKIESLLAVFAADPHCGYVFSDADLIDGQGKALGRTLWEAIVFDAAQQARFAGPEQLSIMLKRFTLPYGMTMGFRAAFSSKLLPFECRFYRSNVHDGWISLLLTSIGAHGVAVPRSLVKYRQHSNQLASAGRPLGFLELMMNPRSQTTELYTHFADFLDSVAARVREVAPLDESAQCSVEQLTGKARHLRARIHANSSHGFERFKTVMLEAVSGRYGKYSRSLKSVVKDLITN
jgi:glycosyltransferase involved in cell wall biosynthesis